MAEYTGYKKPYEGGYQKKERSEYTPKSPEPHHGLVYQAYAVVGNKEVPSKWLEWAEQTAIKLDELGFTLRTGGGAMPLEEAFENATTHKEIHLPWKEFNQKESSYTRTHAGAAGLIRKLQPNFESLKPAVQAILSRNAAVIYGKDLRSPVRFLITYTDDGVEHGKDRTSQTGFAGLAIGLAGWLKIPVYNLKNEEAVSKLKIYVDALTITV